MNECPICTHQTRTRPELDTHTKKHGPADWMPPLLAAREALENR